MSQLDENLVRLRRSVDTRLASLMLLREQTNAISGQNKSSSSSPQPEGKGSEGEVPVGPPAGDHQIYDRSAIPPTTADEFPFANAEPAETGGVEGGQSEHAHTAKSRSASIHQKLVGHNLGTAENSSKEGRELADPRGLGAAEKSITAGSAELGSKQRRGFFQTILGLFRSK